MTSFKHKARKVILCLFLFSIQLQSQNPAGCGGLHLAILNGISICGSPATCTNQSINVSSLDSFDIVVYSTGQWHCWDVQDLFILRNEDTLVKNVSFYASQKVFKVLGLPGRYKVKCKWNYSAILHPLFWEFDLVVLTTGIKVEDENSTMKLYPNPVRETLFLENESSAIQEVKIFSTTGELVLNEKPNLTQLAIPVTTWPKGIYYLQVATLSEKILIRKLLVQ